MDGRAPIRVLFLLERPENWLNVHRLWVVMRDDPRFEPEVFIVPPITLETAARERQIERCRAVCAERGVAGEVWQEGQTLEPGRFDVAIFNLPYDRQRPPELYFDFVKDKVGCTVYIPYGLVTGDGQKNRRLQYAQPAQRRADIVVARSYQEKRAYRRFCPTGDRHVAVLGLPRMDELFELDSFAVDPELQASVAGRLALLWNSHYTFLPRFADAENYSTFDRLAGGLFGYAATHPDVALIWRPHPHLFGELTGAGIFGADELHAFKREVAELGVILDERPDHRHSFAVSQALLTDAGSFVFEYLATGKPVVYLRNPEGEPLNEEAEALVRHYDVAESEEELIAFIDGLRQHGDVRREQRLAARHSFLPMFDGRASQRLADRIAERCARGARGVIDPERYPLLDRLMTSLGEIRAEKRLRAESTTALPRRGTAAKEWVLAHLTEHPKLLKGLSAVFHRLGVRKASAG